MTQRVTQMGKRIGMALLCLALLVWSVAPPASHLPTQVSDMVQDHGHSHDDVVDLAWSSHGHSHDVMDHDHSTAHLPRPIPLATPYMRDAPVGLAQISAAPFSPTTPERPPRA